MIIAPLMAKRRGITLMEVLISVAVAAIGLLGVAALIPVAAYQAQEGARNDRAANVGRRSFRELRVRGYHSPGTSNEPNWFDTSGPNRVFDVNGSLQRRAFAIDPIGIANSAQANFPQTLQNTPCPRMPRLSLRATAGPGPMSAAQAEECFVFQDDLEWEIPKSKNAVPIQKMIGNNAKRASKGEFSWFVTVFPSTSDWRTVSTVITRDRPKQSSDDYIGKLPVPGSSGSDLARLAAGGAGFNLVNDASDVVVRWLDVAPKPLKVGHWVMLSQDTDANPPVIGDEIFAWYRVKGVGEQQVNGANILQPLQLHGPAWDTSRETYMTWMPSVVAVYTREMQITAGP